ncbi:hypothetical protein [Arthrobacter bussei]|uniref:hypothetical protein n=1 Tax=Arthrobacter bussei TaxID=2594179 RepID=UPI00178246B2|nr:hypothetical protein [Arthrobacter bussei]
MTSNPEVQALTNEYHCGLRSWAKVTYTIEAATELLIRAHESCFVRSGQPWIGMGSRWPYVDFEAIEGNLEGLSGGERRFMLLVASLGDGGALVDLGDVIPGLDRDVCWHLSSPRSRTLAEAMNTQGSSSPRTVRRR